MESELGRILDNVRPVVENALQLAALIAIATLVAVQMIKPLMRLIFHVSVTGRWFLRRDRKVDDFRSAKSSPPVWLVANGFDVPSSPGSWQPFSQSRFWSLRPIVRIFGRVRFRSFALTDLMPFLPTALYLKRLQNLAQSALERPTQDEELFAYFAADASPSDMVVAYKVDAAVQLKPELLEKLTLGEESPSQKGVAAAVASAQDNVSTCIERGLDDLQIRLMFWWPIVMRIVVVAVAITLSLLVLRARAASPAPLSGQSVLLFVAIGAGAAYLASFVYDALSFLASFRPRPQ